MAIISNGTTIADAGAFNASLGSKVLIKTTTVSSATANVTFVHGTSGVVLDSTYPIYQFVFLNCLPSSDGVKLKYNFSIDTGSNYNVTKTSDNFYAGHTEADATGFGFDSGLAQSTSDAFATVGAIGSAADEGCSGFLHLFDPSSTTFVKHYISNGNAMVHTAYLMSGFCGGYANTTSAINAIDFKFQSGNVDSGTIDMYGVL